VQLVAGCAAAAPAHHCRQNQPAAGRSTATSAVGVQLLDRNKTLPSTNKLVAGPQYAGSHLRSRHTTLHVHKQRISEAS
jgi:hypothetical protein